ncbi:hypothetical protein [Amycolatopsis alba]|uniref:ESX-1 secretion-associated protein n=1 Tax=Amycolatopsis alba DSM 44262 TaxID=1125972 RepID=A0A229RGU6_AMYAL|nr:hypothetical protein [Amycolatopsis alba]OXM45624.1 hypothetical protein CFP75_30305 [Amycolatopsis alba DSM 44262]
MGYGDHTDGDTAAMEAFSERVLTLVQDIPEALRYSVEPACAGGMGECGDLTDIEAKVTHQLQKFITDVRYGLHAYGLFVRDEGQKYLAASDSARREILSNVAKRQDTGLPEVAPQFPVAVVGVQK